MADDPNLLPSGRLVRWLALAVLIGFAIALYFRDTARVHPIVAEQVEADSLAPPSP